MKKGIGLMVAAVMVLALAGAAFARWNGPGMGYGPGRCQNAAVDAETMKKFQKETLSLRDELMVKKIDLRAEFDKAEPDSARVAALRKEIGDLREKIQAIAEKHGLPAGGPGMGAGMRDGRGPGRGMMAGGGPGCGMRADCPCNRF